MAHAHVVPLRDLVAHHVPGVDVDAVTDPRPWFVTTADWSEGPDCVCSPTVELVLNDDGADGWMFTHHSLDGREIAERTEAT